MKIYIIDEDELKLKPYHKGELKRGSTLLIDSKMNMEQNEIEKAISQIGSIQLLTIKNPIYTVEGYLRELKQKTDLEVVIKLGDEFLKIEDDEVLYIENIFDFPHMKLWTYHEENKIIYSQR